MKKTILSFILLLTLFSCTKEVFTDNNPQLKIITRDSENNLISNASVSLYINVDDWSKDENILITKQTDINGEVLFEDLSEEIYYFYIEKEEKNNRYEIAKTENRIQINEITKVTVIIKPYI